MDVWDDLIGFIQTSCEQHLGDSPKSYGVLLASEELLSNMIRAASEQEISRDSSAQIRIQCWMSEDPERNRFVIGISDTGPPFDPCLEDVPEALPDVPIEKRPIGGLGLFLVKTSVDEVSYRYEEGRNSYVLSTFLV
jgi:anti-sigma regulatory factor (Ser/Thr protein kinase)